MFAPRIKRIKLKRNSSGYRLHIRNASTTIHLPFTRLKRNNKKIFWFGNNHIELIVYLCWIFLFHLLITIIIHQASRYPNVRYYWFLCNSLYSINAYSLTSKKNTWSKGTYFQKRINIRIRPISATVLFGSKRLMLVWFNMS